MILSWGTAEETREFVLRVIKEVAKDGGYIMDAGAIMQDDTSVENMKVMTEVCREYGVPSVTGTGFATQVIKTGDIIKVDGDTGLVEIVKRAG